MTALRALPPEAPVTISSRTPEGSPHQCPICGGEVALDPSEISDDVADAPCPRCGHLLRWIRRHLAKKLGLDPKDVDARAEFLKDRGADSLDTVELVMELAEEFDLTISDEDAQGIRTVEDAIRYISDRLGDDRVPDTSG